MKSGWRFAFPRPFPRLLLSSALSLSLWAPAWAEGSRVDMDALSGMQVVRDGLEASWVWVRLRPQSKGLLHKSLIEPDDKLLYQTLALEQVQLKNGKAELGLQIEVYDSQGQLLKANPDVWQQAREPETLSLLEYLYDPAAWGLNAAGAYVLKGRLFDKNGSGTIRFVHPFEIQAKVQRPFNPSWKVFERGPYLQVISQDLSFETVALLDNQGQTLEGNQFTAGQQLSLRLGQLQGFQAAEGKVYPGLQLTVLGPGGQVLLSNPDLYAAYSQSGVPVATATHAVVSNLTLDPELFQAGQKYLWVLRLFDKKSENQLGLKLPFEVR